MNDLHRSAAIHVSKAFEEGADMSGREQEILEDIVAKIPFSPGEVLWRSSYWNTNQIGAVHYKGHYEGRQAVLKIQGVKPEISEIQMIEQYKAQNRSDLIRPPYLFVTIPWDDTRQYEALIMEYANGKKVLQSGQMQTPENIKIFLQMYKEYRKNCLPQKPWFARPSRVAQTEVVKNLIKQSIKAYPKDQRRKESDEGFVYHAAEILDWIYKDIPLEFLHGHFSTEDLISHGDDVLLFSNLFWKWKYPFYDAVFGYHWFMYGLQHVPEITPQQIEGQRSMWLDILFALPAVKASGANARLLKAALLERAIAGVIIDSFLVDKENPIADYFIESTREQVRLLEHDVRM